MQIKSLLLTLALLFTAQNYCAAANDSKTQEVTLTIEFRELSRKMSDDHKKDLIKRFKNIFPKAVVSSTYIGRWLKCCIIDCQKHIDVLKSLGLEECLYVPLTFFKNKSDGDSVKLTVSNNIIINFVLKDGFISRLKSA